MKKKDATAAINELMELIGNVDEIRATDKRTGERHGDMRGILAGISCGLMYADALMNDMDEAPSATHALEGIVLCALNTEKLMGKEKEDR